jgi:hypothetical protein
LVFMPTDCARVKGVKAMNTQKIRFCIQGT